LLIKGQAACVCSIPQRCVRNNIKLFTQFIRLEYITIFLLMKRIIIKIQNNINQHYLIAIGMSCVFILRNILDFAHVNYLCEWIFYKYIVDLL
jgi:hypothetical protein